jgi:tRNA (cmo5U34)-methyltransferase
MSAKPEEMNSFFNVRADSYDEHIRNSIELFDSFYKKISDPIPETSEVIAILDLGAGTGLELEHIFRKAPTSRITAIDLSSEMLTKLLEKFYSYRSQIKTVVESYLTVSFQDWRTVDQALVYEN